MENTDVEVRTPQDILREGIDGAFCCFGDEPEELIMFIETCLREFAERIAQADTCQGLEELGL